ncbi:MAG: hypothetical protein ACRDRL_31560, partial [Sciscionella sp.]
ARGDPTGATEARQADRLGCCAVDRRPDDFAMAQRGRGRQPRDRTAAGFRRESQRDAKHQAAQILHDGTPPEPTGPVEEDRLRRVFNCCHPARAVEARVALNLPARRLTVGAIRLGRLLRTPPHDGEVAGLLALMLLTDAQRLAADGEPPRRYQPLAAINAVHTDTPSACDAD